MTCIGPRPLPRQTYSLTYLPRWQRSTRDPYTSALDECHIGIDLLRAIQQLGPSFSVLVTSRPIFREIHETPSIRIRASDEDILVAVDTTLSKLKHAWLDEKLKETIRKQVVDKADGMFLLASLQLRELARDVTCKRDVIAILDSLPRTLDDAANPRTG